MKELESRLAKFGIRPGLERIDRICNELGRPQDRLKVILVTGTNGKGSVVACLASMLTAAGHRTGSYFSPHISSYRERFKIDGLEITDAEFAHYEREMLTLHDDKKFEMTLFEALTGIAFRYFADKGCEWAVVEIGMGGRFDATNVAREEMAIITNVDLEHTDYLGATVSDIARDKSQIIKNPSGRAVTGCSGEALGEVRARAAEVGAPLRVLGEDFSCAIRQARPDGTVFDYSGRGGGTEYRELWVPLAGRHQSSNAGLAVAAASELQLGEDAIRQGLAKARHPGRLQIVSFGRNPLIVADGAHNPDGIRTLVKSLDIYPRTKLVCVFSALRDKDWRTMLSVLAPLCDEMIINQMPGERAERAEDIAEEALRHTKATVVRDIGDSVRTARRRAGKGGMVLICGSLYMLGDAIDAAKRPG